MGRLLLFNPQNDAALACDRPGFTPGRGAMELSRAGALLPMWWAEPGDEVLVDDPALIPISEEMAARYGLHGKAATAPSSSCLPMPWGWSRYTKRLFLRAGVHTDSLPSDEAIDCWRQLSHRRTAIAINRLIGTPAELIPIEAFSLSRAIEAVNHFGRAVAKLPWSSSGRGILFCHDIPRPTLENYLSGIIHRQGSVIIEPYFERVQDFATLFYCDGTRVEFKGLSAFSTNSRGSYISNIVMNQSALLQYIGLDIDPYKERLAYAIQQIVIPSHYRGYIGIDMLSYIDNGGSIRIAPCIEMNLRNTMGVLSLHLAQKLLKADQSAVFNITKTTDPNQAINLSPAPNCPVGFYLNISESIS